MNPYQGVIKNSDEWYTVLVPSFRMGGISIWWEIYRDDFKKDCWVICSPLVIDFMVSYQSLDDALTAIGL